MVQFQPNELGNLFDKFLPFYRQRKKTYWLVYILLLFYLSLPSFMIPTLEWGRFRVTALMEQRAIENYMLFYPRQSWSSFGDINPMLPKCIIGLEDGKFFNHKGIDWYELEKSLATNKRRQKVARGGSTITMQLAKNLFLNTNRSVLRKAKEFVITLRMEKEISKEAILTNYLNAVEWGDGIFGAKKAADIYFNKKPSELSFNECSRMAAVIPSPLRHKPSDNSGYVGRRATRSRGRSADVNISE